MQTNINITVSMTGNRKTSAHFTSIMLLRRPKRQGNWKQKECVSEARVCQSSCIPAWQAQASVGLWAGVCSWGYHVLLALHSTLFLYQFQSVCVCVCVCMCVCVEWGRCQDRRVSLGMGATTVQEPGGGFLTRGDTQRRFLVKLVLPLNPFLLSLSLSLWVVHLLPLYKLHLV